jgi:thioredoxin
MIAMNAEMFNQYVNEGSKPVLVEFWAPWCVYCRRIAPVLKKMAQEREDVVIAQINIDEEPLLAHQEHIEVIPTLILYQNGQALGSIVAPESKAKIEEFLEDNLGF